MGILICIKGKNRVKTLRIGNAVEHLTMFMAAFKDSAERIAIEKRISIHDAERFILDCIVDVKDSLN